MTDERETFNSVIKPQYRRTHTPQCAKCMRFEPWGSSAMEVHHIIALADGGSNDTGNLTVLCSACHEEWHMHTEGTKDFSEWRSAMPLWAYSAIGAADDPSLKREMLVNAENAWPTVKDQRMVKQPYKNKRCAAYTKAHSTEWIDW